MAIYQSDGKKLVDVEYDTLVQVGDTVDSMRVISVDTNSDEYAVFLVEPSSRITCYIFDEIFIVGKTDSFENLSDAIEAWRDEQI